MTNNVPYTPVPHVVLDRLASAGLSGGQIAIVLAIMRMSFGYHREEAELSVRELSRRTGRHRTQIGTDLQTLMRRRIIARTQEASWSHSAKYIIRPVDEWEGALRAVTGTKGSDRQCEYGEPLPLVPDRQYAQCHPVTALSDTSKDNLKNKLKNKKRAARSHRLPADFVISAELRAWAKNSRPDLNIEKEIEVFRDYEFLTPHSDWTATFRNWIRRARPQQLNSGKKSCHETNMETFARFLARDEAERKAAQERRLEDLSARLNGGGQ